MRNFKDLIEARGDTAVFTLGRFNPPTTGHEKLIIKLDSVAKQNGSEMYVFPTHSNDPAKNPLPHGLKVAYMKKMYKKYAKNIKISKARNVFEVAKVLYDKGHKSIIMVVGSDRVTEFTKLLEKYNGTKSTHGFYEFDNIQVVSAGERDPDAEGVSGMSASKMRAAAADGDKDSFLQGVPSSFKDGDKLYSDVRKNMGILEERDMGDMSDFEAVRDAYLTGKIWNVGDVVESNGVSGEVVRKGTNYLSFVSEDGKVNKAWLHDITLDERNYAKEYANYHSRPEQIARRSSRNKARRAMGDKVVKGMDVGHADNDPMNNDPKNLRNEDPSDNRREPRLREKEELDEKIEGLVNKAKKSGMPYSILKKVYDRGMAAWKTGHRPGTTPQQWAFARVNSFTTKSAGTWGKADSDLAKQVEQIEEACWDGYKQVGMKKKGDKEVPNCVPEETDLNEWGEMTEKDDKSGKELNNPTKGDIKKYKVYVRNDKGNVVKVEFGDPNMEIKRDDPQNRANFRARHNCDQKKDKTTAGYWSCKFWSSKSVTDLMKG